MRFKEFIAEESKKTVTVSWNDGTFTEFVKAKTLPEAVDKLEELKDTDEYAGVIFDGYAFDYSDIVGGGRAGVHGVKSIYPGIKIKKAGAVYIAEPDEEIISVYSENHRYGLHLAAQWKDDLLLFNEKLYVAKVIGFDLSMDKEDAIKFLLTQYKRRSNSKVEMQRLMVVIRALRNAGKDYPELEAIEKSIRTLA